jgi:hypothetical protein
MMTIKLKEARPVELTKDPDVLIMKRSAATWLRKFHQTSAPLT